MKPGIAPLWVTGFFLATMMSAEGRVVAQNTRCGVLFTEQECSAYLNQLDHARSAQARMVIETAHEALLKERARLCPGHSTMHDDVKVGPAPSRPDLPTAPAPRIWM